MKIISIFFRKNIINFIAYLLCLSLYQTSGYAQDTLTFSKSNDPIANISEAVLREAYKKIGIDIKTIILPAERSLHTSNAGDTDGEINRIRGIENKYPNLRMVSISVNILEGIVFTKGLQIKITDWNSLKPYRIGIRRGTKFAERGTEGMNVNTISSNEQLFGMLNKGRHEVIVAARLEGLKQVKKLNLKDVFAVEPPLVTLKLYHYLHKKHIDLLPQIQSVLKKMADEGRIETIRKETIEKLINSKN